jgi:hypothetical protein
MTELLTPSRLWKKMTPEQRFRAARAFWLDDESTNDQVQAVLLIAQHKHFRPKTIVSLDTDRKAKHLASLPSVPDGIAARALVGYHLAEQRPMMAQFLDALGIPHEEGLIQDDATKPDPDKMKAAVDSLAGTYQSEDVSLYLNTLVCQDPETWNGLTELMA